MKSQNVIRIVLGTVLLAAVAWTADLGKIKEDMKKRLPEVNRLKQEKLVGENRDGYLDVLKAVAAKEQKTVDAENDDRKAVYEAIAAQTGASTKAVGRLRAEDIREQTKPGIMIQMPDGTWKEK